MMKAKQAGFGWRTWVVSIAMLVTAFGLPGGPAIAQDGEPQFTTEFRFKDCKFKNKGVNPFFILKPGYQLVFEGEEDGDLLRVVKTVLNKTETIDVPGIGKIRTRVLKEQEYVNGRLVEESLNFFAICEKTNDVVYFGEEVDIFLPNGTIVHDGAWRAGVDGALPGIIMPGTFLLGSRYFQEQAPNAMDQAEHVEMGLTMETEAGTFNGCVRIIETSPLEPGAESEKIYCPGVGLVVDNDVELVEINSKKNGKGGDADD
ncbi:MAG: hypothetical protein ACREQK_04280 [Candidatus Binatia bacterium]